MSMIDREEAIRIIASYPGPVDKSVVRRLLTQMDEEQDESEYWHEKASSYEQTIVRLCETAQLKIMRCRDCKWWDSEYRECHSPNWDTGTDEHFITPPGFFCGWVEMESEQDG